MKTATDPNRSALGDFLRSRRERLSPKVVGLSSGRRRRTPGLRREEVAALAGIIGARAPSAINAAASSEAKQKGVIRRAVIVRVSLLRTNTHSHLNMAKMRQCKQTLTNFQGGFRLNKVNASETENERPLQPPFCQRGLLLIP